jgi:hypothetical protein
VGDPWYFSADLKAVRMLLGLVSPFTSRKKPGSACIVGCAAGLFPGVYEPLKSRGQRMSLKGKQQ